VELIVKFLPELLSLMVDNALRGVYRQLKEDHTPFSASNGFINCLSKHPSAMHITCTYALHLMEKKDMKSLSLLLPTIAKGCDDPDAVSVPDVFLHLLVLELSQQYETLREATLLSLLNDFWVPCCQGSESALLQFCRFFWTFHARLHPTTLAEILEAVNPSEEASSYRKILIVLAIQKFTVYT
jgi:negative elongation factor B